jgi:uncharacterized membrane protein HdeD (DUF308 family)
MSPIPYDQLAPIQHMYGDLFLLGFATACSLVAGLFFLRFWRATRDRLFLGFAAFFLFECASNVVTLNLSHPNEGNAWVFLLRLIGTLAVLGAILEKNTARG